MFLRPFRTTETLEALIKSLKYVFPERRHIFKVSLYLKLKFKLTEPVRLELMTLESVDKCSAI